MDPEQVQDPVAGEIRRPTAASLEANRLAAIAAIRDVRRHAPLDRYFEQGLQDTPVDLALLVTGAYSLAEELGLFGSTRDDAVREALRAAVIGQPFDGGPSAANYAIAMEAALEALGAPPDEPWADPPTQEAPLERLAQEIFYSSPAPVLLRQIRIAILSACAEQTFTGETALEILTNALKTADRFNLSASATLYVREAWNLALLDEKVVAALGDSGFEALADLHMMLGGELQWPQ